MVDNKSVNDSENAVDHSTLKAEMDELKREMRSAKWAAWAQNNKQLLLAGLAGLVLILLASGLWIENDRSHRASAAILYQQALSEQDVTMQQTLLESVKNTFSDTTYGALALMKLARLDLEANDKASALSNTKLWIKENPNSVDGYQFILPLVSGNQAEQDTYEY